MQIGIKGFDMNNAWVIAVSLGNLLILPFWINQWAIGTPFDDTYFQNRYHLGQDGIDQYGHIAHTAALGLWLVLVIVFYPVIKRIDRTPWMQKAFVFLSAFALVTALNTIRIIHFPFLAVGPLFAGPVYYIAPALICLIGVAWVVWKWRAYAAGIAQSILAILAPLSFVTAINGIMAVWQLTPEGASPFHTDFSPQPMKSTGAGALEGRRAVVVIFDSWEHKLTFENTDPTIELDHLSALRHHAAVLRAKAFGPGTLRAIPALVTGRENTGVRAKKGIDLYLALNKEETETSFAEHPSLFDDVSALGGNVALVGTAYHPLCLMFRRAVNSCYGMGYWPNRNREHVLTRLDDVLRSISLKVPGVVRLKARFDGAQTPHPHVAGFLKTLNELDKRIVDPAHSLIYVHLLMPYRPYFYDRHLNDFVPPRDDNKHYADALELVDRTVGRIVKSLKKSGSSDDTLLVLTADHGFKNDAIPLVIKWPGKKFEDIPRSLVRPFGLRSFVRAYLAGEDIAASELGNFFPPYAGTSD